MKNIEICEYIKRFCVNKEECGYHNNDIVYSILAHGFLFVKAGKETDRFMVDLARSLKYGVDEGVTAYFEEGCVSSVVDCIYNSVAQVAIDIARNAFDADYYNKQLNRMDMNEEESDVSILDKYMALLDEEHLYEFMCLVGSLTFFQDVFGEWKDECTVWDKLYIACRELDRSIPDKENDWGAYNKFVDSCPRYMFDYLSKESIVSVYRKVITKNEILAGNMARALYYSGDIMMVGSYTRMIAAIQRMFNIDVYKPSVLELEKARTLRML